MKLDGVEVHHGDCLDVLKTLPDCSIDAVVTDPPYELGFMGKSWDSSGIAFNTQVWAECLRVLKPGGHILAFGGSRTWHRLAVAVEDAGFELRDSIAWLYGSGFPKSLDISKAIDKVHGAQREEWPTLPMQKKGEVGEISKNRRCAICLKALASGNPCQCDRSEKAITPDAQKWQGWGTALKPAFEPIVVGRKPLTGTVAENVLEWGTGGLNIDGTRIGTETVTINTFDNGAKPFGDAVGEPFSSRQSQGRWPSNVMLDEYTAALIDEQSGISVSKSGGKSETHPSPMDWGKENSDVPRGGFNDSGGASRFFYVAKASKRDRNEGLDELEATTAGDMVDREEGSAGMNSPRAGAGRTSGAKNFHPTVKPTDLMRQLVRLVTPPGGTVLDPFTGSGSTGKATILEGFKFVGIELTEEYLPIIEGRLRHAIKVKAEMDAKDSEALF